MLRRPTPSTSLLRRSSPSPSPSPSPSSLRSLSHTASHSAGRPWSYKPQLRPEGVAWKKDTPITFSHGFVRKELTPSPARQPPKVAPYGPGSGTHTDPQIAIGPGAKSSDLPVISGASRYGPGRVIAGRRAEREEGRVSSPQERRALPAPEQTRSRFDPMNEFGGQMEGYGFKQPAAADAPAFSKAQPERIDEPGFMPATSFTGGGFGLRDMPPPPPEKQHRGPAAAGSLRDVASKVRREGPALRSQYPDVEQLPSPDFFSEKTFLRANPPTRDAPHMYGREPSVPLTESAKFTRARRLEQDKEESALWETEEGEDDEEAAAWRDADTARNSDISVSMAYEPEEIDPEAIAAAEARINAKAETEPAPRPYSTGFNFAPIPGDVGPSNLVPAKKIVPNYDPTGWAQLPVPTKGAATQAAPLVSPRYELPSVVSQEWKGDALEDRFAGSRQGGGLFEREDESQPLVAKKRKGDPTPAKAKDRSLPHPSLTLGYTGPITQVLSPSTIASSSSSTPVTYDPNDPMGKFAEVSMDDPLPLSPHATSSDPLLQPWSYTAPLAPSLTPKEPKPVPTTPTFYPGEPRHPSIELPAWSLRKAAVAKLMASTNADGSTHWRPTHKVPRSTMEEMRRLAREDPMRWNMKTLSEMHDLSPEAVRRILKSKWQEKDEAPWEVASGERVDEVGGMDMLEVDAEEMEREVRVPRGSGPRKLKRMDEEERKKKELSEDDPFGDIDEMDEGEWKLAGGSRLEEEFERKQEEEERLGKEMEMEAARTAGSSGGPSNSLPSTSAPAAGPKRRSLLSSYKGPSFPTPSPSASTSTNTPTSDPQPSGPPRAKHDARLSDPSPWISTPSSSSLLSSLPSHPPSPNDPSPFASALASATRRQEWAANQQRYHSEAKAAKLKHVFAGEQKGGAPSRLRVPSRVFDGRREQRPAWEGKDQGEKGPSRERAHQPGERKVAPKKQLPPPPPVVLSRGDKETMFGM